MKTKTLCILFLLLFSIQNCGKDIDYSETFKEQTQGKYLYNPDEIIEVYYENDNLFLIWKKGKIQPVALATNEFFVADMYTKLHFVQHPETNERYLSKLSEDEGSPTTYDYLKVSDSYKTPSQILEDKDYEKALEGYLAIKKQDSTSSYINEWDFNRLGYKHIRNKDYEDAIEVFKLNASLHPNSVNVYDSLADAYLMNNDSANAYANYKIAYDMNPRNRRAKEFVDAYTKKLD
ncbi:tetratricopeptide repeat protein [Winogradskyella sp.]|uniref:tetratricopeptide repeat protein n=1 Tax=Winogradskyella sp. TaxID=1883156 RepID=UPI003F6C261B